MGYHYTLPEDGGPVGTKAIEIMRILLAIRERDGFILEKRDLRLAHAAEKVARYLGHEETGLELANLRAVLEEYGRIRINFIGAEIVSVESVQVDKTTLPDSN